MNKFCNRNKASGPNKAEASKELTHRYCCLMYSYLTTPLMANHFAYIYVKIIFNSIQLLSLLCLSQTHTSLHSYKEIKSVFTEQASNTEDRNITVPAQHSL